MTTTAPDTATTTLPITTAADRTLGTVSLVLGIASIVTGFQFVLGAAAIVLGILALRRETASGNFALAGIITGSVSALGLIWGFFGLLALLPFAGIAAVFW